MIPGPTPATVSVSLGTRTGSDLALQPEPMATAPTSAPHGACLVTIGPTSGNTAVVQLTGATALEVDLSVVAAIDVTVSPC